MTAVYVPVNPDGTVWRRAFRTQHAAWRTIVGGANSDKEWFDRKLEKVRQGWRVELRAETPQWPVIGARPRSASMPASGR
jgi:hypothetical protein